jgi:tRNA (cmo5U34)-methyltransferase
MNTSDNTTPFNAAQYDENVVKVIPYYELFHAQTIDLVKTVQPNPSLWLDTGCGTGRLVEQAYQVFANTRFVLADPSAGMLSLARQRLGHLNERVAFVPDPMGHDLIHSLEQSPQVITAIICHHYSRPDDRRQMTEDIYTLLAGCGVYITFEIIRPPSARTFDVSVARWRRLQLANGRKETEVNQHLARFDNSVFPITISEHIQLLKDTGFAEVDLFWASYMQAGFYAIKG